MTSSPFAMTAVPARDIAVVLLAAGVGRRLGDATPGPKVLLEFSGQTLLERHLRTLMSYSIFFDSYFPHASKDNLTGERHRILFITYNLAEYGDVRDRYHGDKRASYPPDVEREEGTEYRFSV